MSPFNVLSSKVFLGLSDLIVFICMLFFFVDQIELEPKIPTLGVNFHWKTFPSTLHALLWQDLFTPSGHFKNLFCTSSVG